MKTTLGAVRKSSQVLISIGLYMIDTAGQIFFEFIAYGTGELIVRCIPSSKIRSALSHKRKIVEVAVRGKRKKNGKYTYDKQLKTMGQDEPDKAWTKAPDGTIVLSADTVALVGLSFWVMIGIGVLFGYLYWST
jgi:hypothetical protein